MSVWNLKEPVLRMWWLADEHAFQLLVEALHAAAQSRDQCRQGSKWHGNWLSLSSSKATAPLRISTLAVFVMSP